eukprot:Colp12_sorted_trinity150504_noHs@14917
MPINTSNSGQRSTTANPFTPRPSNGSAQQQASTNSTPLQARSTSTPAVTRPRQGTLFGNQTPVERQGQRSEKPTPALMSKEESNRLLTEFSTTERWPIGKEKDVALAYPAEVRKQDQSGKVIEIDGLRVIRPGVILAVGTTTFCDHPPKESSSFITFNKDNTGFETFVVNSKLQARRLPVQALSRVYRHAWKKTDPDFGELLGKTSRTNLYYEILPNGARIPVTAPHLLAKDRIPIALKQLRREGLASSFPEDGGLHVQQDGSAPMEMQQQAAHLGPNVDSATDSDTDEDQEPAPTSSTSKRPADTTSEALYDESGNHKQRRTSSSQNATSNTPTSVQAGARDGKDQDYSLFIELYKFAKVGKEGRVFFAIGLSDLGSLGENLFALTSESATMTRDCPWAFVRGDGGSLYLATQLQLTNLQAFENKAEVHFMQDDDASSRRFVDTILAKTIHVEGGISLLCICDLPSIPRVMPAFRDNKEPKIINVDMCGRTYFVMYQ